MEGIVCAKCGVVVQEVHRHGEFQPEEGFPQRVFPSFDEYEAYDPEDEEGEDRDAIFAGRGGVIGFYCHTAVGSKLLARGRDLGSTVCPGFLKKRSWRGRKSALPCSLVSSSLVEIPVSDDEQRRQWQT